MLKVRSGLAIGLLAQLALLITLAATVSLSPVGWLAGISCGVITNVMLARGLDRAGAVGMGPADKVTLTRATLVGGVAALVADSLAGPIPGPIPVPTLVSLSAVALVLDGVDGWVARRTGTVSKLGAIFDQEVDAFLILILSMYVARLTGDWWVLTIGAARYVFAAVGWLQPWLRVQLPPRYWRKVVAAIQGVVLTVVAADLLPSWPTTSALVVALALLAESFGRDVWWAWQHRTTPDREAPDDGKLFTVGRRQVAQRGSVRATVAIITTVLACALVWFALVAPNHTTELTPAAFLRIPLEGLLLIAMVLVLPTRASGILAVLVGGVLGVLTVLKIVGMGFYQALDRPFNPLTDWTYLQSAVGLIIDSLGRPAAIASVIVAALATVAVLILMPLALLRLTRLAARHRSTSIRSVTAVGIVWVLSAVLGVQIVNGAPFASTSAAGLTYDQVNQIRDEITDQQAFAQAVADDRFGGNPTPVAAAAAAPTDGSSPSAASRSDAVAATPDVVPPGPATANLGAAVATGSVSAAVGEPSTGADLLGALRGKDVIFAFVESYGRVAIQDSSFAPGVDATLDAGTGELQAAGFGSKSGFLNSPTFGGLSWLAHSTLQSGLRIDNQQRYDQLLASDRLTLAGAFKQAGWRTVAEVPSNEKQWPEGVSFYHYDQIYDGTNMGYQGPTFSYASMTDQYVMSSFRQLELERPNRGPVMAEIDLVSSHWPWAPLPRMVDWADVGDGSTFDEMPAEGQLPDVIAQDPAQVQAAYGQSIQYTLNTMISFVQTYGDDNLVLVMLGDHEPHTAVSGGSTTHDVPISIIARDPAVLARISDWGWQDGLRPGPTAPVWPMEDFRDRFLTAFGS